jgi:hypothetical protein
VGGERMAGTIDEYKRLFKEATVADQTKLFQLYIAIYLVVNLVHHNINFKKEA